MSGKITGAVWDLDLPHSKQLVLLSMADHADHEGNNVFPSVGLVAWKTGYSTRQVQRIQRDLVKAGLLVIVKQTDHTSTTYRINVSAGKVKSPYVSKDDLRDDKMSPPKTNLKEIKKETRGDTATSSQGRHNSVIPGVTQLRHPNRQEPSGEPSLFANAANAGSQSEDKFDLDGPVDSKEWNKFLEKKTDAAAERLSQSVPTSKKNPEPTKTAEKELPKESSAKEKVSPVLAQVVGATDPVVRESPYGHNSVSFTPLTLHDCELAGEFRFKAKADVWVEWGNWSDEVLLSDRQSARIAFFKGWDKSRERWNQVRFEEIGKASTQPDMPQPIPFLAIPPIAPEPPVEATRPAGADKYNELRATSYYAVNHDLKQVALTPAEQYVQKLSTPGWVHEMGIVIKTSEAYLEYTVIPEYPSSDNAPSLNGQGPRTDDLPLPRPTTPETKQEPSGGVFPLPPFANLAWYTCAGESTLVHLAKPTPSGQRLKPICGVKGHFAAPVETASRGNRQPCPDCQRIAAERAAKVERKRISLSPLQKAIGTCLLKQTSEATMDANRPRINTLQRIILTCESYPAGVIPDTGQSQALADGFCLKFIPWYEAESIKRYGRKNDLPSGNDTLPKWYGEWVGLGKPGTATTKTPSDEQWMPQLV